MSTEDQFRRMVSEAPDQAARAALIRARRDGDLKIDDKIPLTPLPTTCDVAPPPPMAVRDRYGRVIQEAAPARIDVAPVTKSFSLGDRAAFEDCIATEPEAKKAEMRLWFDRERKKHGID